MTRGLPGVTVVPPVADAATCLAAVDARRIREKRHMTEGDAIEAARRRLPITEAAHMTDA